MSDLHHVGVSAPDPESRAKLEGVGPEFIRQGLMGAREKSWEALKLIYSRLQEGMTEGEARRLANDTMKELGSAKYWHQPWVRFGPGTALTFHKLLQPTYRLQKGDPVYLDLGPVWRDEATNLEYEGDVGETFIFGENAEVAKAIEASRTLWKESHVLWNEGASGETMYAFLDKRAAELGYRLIDNVLGHRLSDFPHNKYSKERLGKVPFHPHTSLWVLEFQINDPENRFGVFYEDLLF